MTLSAALSSATSSLRSIQTRLSVASNNIANADDVNYTAKTTKQSAVVAGGTSVGVQITAISSDVDVNLVRQIVDATSTSSAAQTQKDYLDSLSSTMGTLSSKGTGDTLATKLSTLESDLDTLATTPESATAKNQVVTDIEDAAADLRSASEEVQSLRTKADSAIADSVTTVNDALNQIKALNDSIKRATANDDSTADLEDMRNAALQTVAAEMDISTYTDATGAMKVYTSSGMLLVGNDVHELSYTAAGTVNASDTYPGKLSGITLDGKDLTQSIRSGNIASLVSLRDTTLPSVQKDMDSLAVGLKNALNTISNQGTAYPPPNSLTGTEVFSGTESLSASGTLRVAVTDSSGKVTATQDFNLSSYATVNDLISDLNSVGGLNASLDSEGHLTLKATSSSEGVAVSGGTIGSENFSGYFGLNDVMTGNDASTISVKSSLSQDPKLFPVGTLSTSATLAVGDTAVTSGSGTVAQSLADALRKSDLTGDAGNIVSSVATLLSSAKVRASSAETTLNTLTDSFSSQFGVNVDEETAKISALKDSYSASAQVLSTIKSMFEDLVNAVR